MRVLLLTPAFVAEGGLCIPGLVDLVRWLMERHAIDVHVVTGDPVRGPRVVRDIPMRAYGSRRNVLRLGELLGRAAVGTKPDVIWSLWVDRTGWPGVALSRLLGVPLVLSVIGSELAELPSIGYGYLRRRSAKANLAILSAAAHCTTVGSHTLYRRLAPIARGAVRIAPLGVPVLPPRVPTGGTRILAVTRLEPVKQPEIMLRTIRSLARSGHPVTLDVYGYATQREVDRLQRDASSYGIGGLVHHRGFVEPQKLGSLYAGYDALLHTSLYESQGMALVEAAAAGLPVACFDVGVALELLELGAPVFIAADEAELSNAVLDALRTIGASTRDRVLERFSIDACGARFEAIFRGASS